MAKQIDVRQGLVATKLRMAFHQRYRAEIETLDTKRASLKREDICDWAEREFRIIGSPLPIRLFLWQKGILRFAVMRMQNGKFRWKTVLYGTVKKCLTPETPVLRYDLTWVPVGSLVEGDELLAFDEQTYKKPGKKGSGGTGRRYLRSVVTHTGRATMPVRRIHLSDGTVLTATHEHKWLTRVRGGKNLKWTETGSLRTGDVLTRFLRTWEPDTSYWSGYIAGCFDGEGHIKPVATDVSLGQKDNALWRELTQALARDGVQFKVYQQRGIYNGHDYTLQNLRISGRAEILRLLGRYRPKRLMANIDMDGGIGYVWCLEHPTVERIEEDVAEVVTLGTSTETYFADGFASHNSGKSTIAGLVARWTAETQTRFGEIYAIGNDFNQAKERAMKEAKFSIQMTPGYLTGKNTLPGRWDVLDGSLRCHLTGSKIMAIPVDAKGEAGGHPALTIWTELWGMESDEAKRFWDEMTRDPTQPDSVRWVETYAGYDGESLLLYGLYDSVVNGGRQLTNKEFAETVCRDVDGERYDDFLHCWDNEQWGTNINGDPNALIPIFLNEAGAIFGYWDEGEVARRFPWQDADYYSGEAATLPEPSFRRLHNNEWVGSESAYIPIEVWDECYDPDLADGDEDAGIAPGKLALHPDLYENGVRTKGEGGVLGVDAASTGDCFALVFVTRHPLDRKLPAIRKVKLFKPEDFPDHRIDFGQVEQWIRDICKSYNVRCIAYDPYQLEDMMQRLNRDRVAWCSAFEQGKDRLEADRGLYDRAMQRKLTHAGDPNLRQHILNAKAKLQKDEDSKMRIIKKAEHRKIDAAVATSMAVARCMYLNI